MIGEVLLKLAEEHYQINLLLDKVRYDRENGKFFWSADELEKRLNDILHPIEK